MDNIGVYKLVTGELIIGKIQETLEDGVTNHILVESPLTIHIIPNQDGKSYRIGMIPYNPVCPEGPEKIYKSAVVSAALTIPPDLRNAYIQQTSGIEIATSLGDVK